jgi:hypothetical protein
MRGLLLRVLALAIVLWLAIGVLAAWQRHYFTNQSPSCAHAGDVVATVLVGPLNYTGVNPKISCSLPTPSQ